MALATTALPYGLRDIKLTPYTDAEGLVLASTSIDLPNARTLSFTSSSEFTDLRGDDRIVTSHGNGETVAWDIEAGGLNFEAFKAMAGATITTSGTTPAAKKVLSKKVTDQRPFFKIEGQAISDSGGDIHVILYRCKATGDLAGEFTDGAFMLTAASGAAYGNLIAGADLDKLYDFVFNETAVATP